MNRTRRQRWVLATSNRGKLAEYAELLVGTGIELNPLDGATDILPEETGATFVENALIKARHAAVTTGQAAIADDSGLCVAALNGAPGVRSARYAGARASDADNIERLLRELDAVPVDQRQAAFYCVIVALESPSDPAPIVACGCWHGQIAAGPRGSHGFGYDPVFFDPEFGLTAAELPTQQKNAVSHRARACAELRRQLAS